MRQLKPERLIVILLSLTALGLLVASLLSYSPKQSALVIDFSKTTSDNICKHQSNKKLRVAVAAMTSPQITRRYYRELLTLIGKQLNREVEFILRSTYSEIDMLLHDNKVDLAFVCAGAYALGSDRYNMELLVIPVINGKQMYNSNIIVRADSTHLSLDDLRHHRFGFTSKTSNTGYMYPTCLLKTRNEIAEEYFSEIIFTHGHDNSIRAVSNGQIDGAAIDSMILDHMLSENDKDARNVKVINTSPDFAIPPIVVPQQLDPILKQQLRDFFLTAHTGGVR